MNIKRDETYKMAQELAAATGESLTNAVTVAVRERLERVRGIDRKSMSARLLEIGKDCAPRLRQTADHGDLLYDEDGMPK